MRLDDREWKAFSIEELFLTIKRGNKRYLPTGMLADKSLISNGHTPRVSATSQNNGIAFFHDASASDDFRKVDNCLTLSFLGDVFYQNTTVTLDMKIHALVLKDIAMNKYIGLFLKTVVRMQTYGITYGNQLSSADAVSKKILLPVTNSGEPDYQFMEDYIRELMERKRKQYVQYAEKQLKELEKTNKIFGGGGTHL